MTILILNLNIQIFSTALSITASFLSANTMLGLAAVLIENVYKGLLRQQLNEKQQGFISKICSILLDIVVMLLTYVISHMGPILNSSTSLLQGLIMDVFFLGFFFLQANHHGGVLGLFLVSSCHYKFS